VKPIAARKTKARAPSRGVDVKPSGRSATVKAALEAMPGATAELVPTPRGAAPIALMYKVMGKVFAILSIRGSEYVILKCDTNLADILREQYTGIGHRSHLDRRFWISVDLDADVPLKETRRLAAGSYELVCAKLTRKQKADLDTLSRRAG
jgi:predicted DNA-binding protein (MmcQ/YjbR family)